MKQQANALLLYLIFNDTIHAGLVILTDSTTKQTIIVGKPNSGVLINDIDTNNRRFYIACHWDFKSHRIDDIRFELEKK